MANLLFLVHRMPYPPDKGDKVRSFHLLKHLVARHRVFVGTFMDDPEDARHVETLRSLCAGLHVSTLHPRTARLASLAGLVTNDALTLHYYRDAALRQWVAGTLEREAVDAVVVFSSSMAQYAEGLGDVPVLVDFVDVDSAKWTAYAEQRSWPLSWLYRREGARLLAYERLVATSAKRSFFCTDKETQLFVQMAPECAGAVESMNNGVDAQYFSADESRLSPFAPEELAVVFTGAMDYWPNVDAVTWFVGNVLPELRRQHPRLRFYIVGRSPTPAVLALASAGVAVTGTVPDVRPYLQHAAVVVAPLRLARGIQNKILEAMAMGRPVVASAACVAALEALPGTEILAAETVQDYERLILELIRDSEIACSIGVEGRRRVLASYTWAAHMSVLDRNLETCAPLAAV